MSKMTRMNTPSLYLMINRPQRMLLPLSDRIPGAQSDQVVKAPQRGSCHLPLQSIQRQQLALPNKLQRPCSGRWLMSQYPKPSLIGSILHTSQPSTAQLVQPPRYLAHRKVVMHMDGSKHQELIQRINLRPSQSTSLLPVSTSSSSLQAMPRIKIVTELSI